MLSGYCEKSIHEYENSVVNIMKISSAPPSTRNTRRKIIDIVGSTHRAHNIMNPEQSHYAIVIHRIHYMLAATILRFLPFQMFWNII